MISLLLFIDIHDFYEDNTDVDSPFEIDMTDDSFSASELELNVNLGEIESGIELPETINKSNDSTGNEGESGT